MLVPCTRGREEGEGRQVERRRGKEKGRREEKGGKGGRKEGKKREKNRIMETKIRR